jgi:Sulfotransferase family
MALVDSMTPGLATGKCHMTVEEIIAEATARTQLTELGDTSVLDGLARLIAAYENEARLTPQGLAMKRETLIGNMAIRMQVEDWLTRHPDLLERPIAKPLFVFGLPRTGTTLMINLLAADPARRCFLNWEWGEPMPPALPDELHAGRRYEEARARGEMALKHVPHIAAIHFEEADSPSECQFLMTPSFCAQVYEAQADIPSWRHWFLHQADYLPAFRFHKRMLQALQHHTGGRWTLKNPWHPLFLDALTEVYPDAQLVMTHRDPAEVVGSCCSLIKYVRQMYSDEVDLKGIGASFMDTFEVMIARADAFKVKHGAGSIHDVQYADTMRDPMSVVRGIYAEFGEPLTAEAEAAMQGYMGANPKGKHGSHSYDLAEFGLSVEGVRERFKDYIESCDIPLKE